MAPLEISGDESSKGEPIAVIGIGCRFPGGANSPEEFWELLKNGVDAITEVPSNRWNIDSYYDADPDLPGKIYTRGGGFLDQVDYFDSQFFGIAPIETSSMDPQQRLLLEVTWESLENAGIVPEKLVKSRTGVFTGIIGTDYSQLILGGDPSKINAYGASGCAHSVASGRLSYLLGLWGPSLSIDTACSSSLVAIHLACQSLKSGESHLALAGGVNLILSPLPTISLSKAHMMSPDGRCKAFDASANGYVRSEGCGMLVLKRYSEARKDGDHIWALILGSAVNQDGRSSGLTVPNGAAQEAVIREGLETSGVKPHQVSFVEAHGTGTSLGDPIEVQALGKVLKEGRSHEEPFFLNSIKTNIGHSEAAAGVASVIRAILSLQHKEMPPHLHLKKLNPNISLDSYPAVIPKILTPVKEKNERLIAGVNSFGFSGTNAHVVLEKVPTEKDVPEIEKTRNINILTLSAKTQTALKDLARRYIKYFKDHPEDSLGDICFTSNCGRSHFPHRLAAITKNKEQLRQDLENFIKGQRSSTLYLGNKPQNFQSKIAFLFTGQGAQYPNMGKKLYETQPIFRNVLDQAQDILKGTLERPLLSFIYPDSKNQAIIDQTAFTQPALFALEWALFELWKSWGVSPDAVMGHSVGEYVAACAAGVLSFEEGLTLIAERARLMQTLPQNGAMAAIFADEKKVEKEILPYGERISISAINSQKNIVISGEIKTIEKIIKSLRFQGLETRPLKVSHAFHSPLMEPILEPFENFAQQFSFNSPQIPFISNLTGKMFGPGEVPDASYWREHIRSPVQFFKGLRFLEKNAYSIFLEIGPNPTLLSLARQCIEKGFWYSSLKKQQEEWETLLTSVAGLYQQGIDLNWEGIKDDTKKKKVCLPPYPFERKRYWINNSNTFEPEKTSFPIPQSQPEIHPLLGRPFPSPINEILFYSQFSSDFPSFLKDHQIQGNIIFPATAFFEMALAGASQELGIGPKLLKDLTIYKPLSFSDGLLKNVQLVFTPKSKEEGTFKIFSLNSTHEENGKAWDLHLSGDITLLPGKDPPPTLQRFPLKKIQKRCQEEIPIDSYYFKLREKGMQHGPSFRGLRKLWKGKGEALAQIELPNIPETNAYNFYLHPVLLDSCFQISDATLLPEEKDYVYLPIGLENLKWFLAPKTRIWCHAKVQPIKQPNQEIRKGNLSLFNEEGEVFAEINGLIFKRISSDHFLKTTSKPISNFLYQVEWESHDSEFVEAQDDPGKWIIFADKKGTADSLSLLLEKHAKVCYNIFSGESLEFLSEHKFKIKPAEPEHFFQVIKKTEESKDLKLQGVIFLWALDTSPLDENSPDPLIKKQEKVCGSILHLIQALAKFKFSDPPRLVFITRGSQHIRLGQNVSSPPQSTLWALGKALAQEHPESHILNLDLDPSSLNPKEYQLILEEILTKSRENQIAIRGQERYVPRLVPIPKDKIPSSALPIFPNGTYLITGGLGALGLEISKWLVQKGARHLILIGRRAPSSSVKEILKKLKRKEVKISVFQADVAQKADLQRVLSKIQETCPPLKGIFHAAGVLDDGLLVQQDWTRFSKVLLPKLEGAWNLHVLTAQMPIDFMVFFSSIASLVGSPGQSNYSAANAFLDALAFYRQEKGIPAISINWGPWAQVGMVANLNQMNQKRLQAQGIEFLTSREALELLETALQIKLPQIGIFSINWKVLMEKVPQKNIPLLFSRQLTLEKKNLKKPFSFKIPKTELIPLLEKASSKERGKLLTAFIQEQVINILGLDASEKLDLSRGFFDIGMDSLMAVELQNRLQTALNYSLPATIGFDYPTIEALAGYLAHTVFSESPMEKLNSNILD